MPAIFLRNELTAHVISGGTEALVTQNRMLATAWVIEDAGALDAFFAFVILDENGEPILDVDGQYLIGG
jgi:hypothetical protein